MENSEPTDYSGLDIIAYVLFSINTGDENRIGLLKKNTNREPYLGAFTFNDFSGGDKNLKEKIKDQVLEKTGFNVSVDDVVYYGKMITTGDSVLSLPNDAYCYLYGVNVNKLYSGTKTTEDPKELQNTTAWLKVPEILDLLDWKSFVIITKRMALSGSTSVIVNAK